MDIQKANKIQRYFDWFRLAVIIIVMAALYIAS